MAPNPFIGIVWKAGLSTSWRATALVTLAIAPLTAHAALNDTGQTTCHDANDAVVACTDAVAGDAGTLPRQDGRFGRDAAAVAGALSKTGGSALNNGVANGFDFSKIANDGTVLAATATQGANPGDWGCTRDNVTGLSWKAASEAVTTWLLATDPAYAPVTDTNTAGLCGHADWRVPTRRELLSIVDYGRGGSASNPAIDPDYFPGTVNSIYWAKESYVPSSANAWGVNFNNGGAGALGKSSSYRVRLVRGGQSSSSFTVLNGTVSDSATGLMWAQCSRGQTTDAACTGTATNFSWAGALAEAAAANSADYLGYHDWRLPNLKELESLVKLDVASQVIDLTVFPNMPLDWYWSGTFYTPIPIVAWFFNFSNGNTGSTNKSLTLPVRLVRGGQSFSPFDVLPPPPPLPGPPDDSASSQQARVEVQSDEQGWQSITGVFVPLRMVSGQTGAVFIFARLPESFAFAPETTWILDSGGTWHLYGDCRTAPTVYTGALQTLNNLPIFPQPLDLTPYAGSELFIGYGLGGYADPSGAACNDMFVRQSWVRVYTQP